MSDEKITALIAEARQASHKVRADSPEMFVDAGLRLLIRRLADALEASVQTPAVDREALETVLARGIQYALHDDSEGTLEEFVATELFASGILQDAAVLEREAEARGLERFADFIEQTYPDDVFRPPSAETYSLANVKLQDAGLVLDSFSADLMRRAGGLARARAQQVRESTPEVPISDNEGEQ